MGSSLLQLIQNNKYAAIIFTFKAEKPNCCPNAAMSRKSIFNTHAKYPKIQNFDNENLLTVKNPCMIFDLLRVSDVNDTYIT